MKIKHGKKRIEERLKFASVVEPLPRILLSVYIAQMRSWVPSVALKNKILMTNNLKSSNR